MTPVGRGLSVAAGLCLGARVQDFGAAALAPAVGIAAGPSATVTHDNGGAAAADMVSGYSDRLGEVVVLQYETGAAGQQGGGGGDSPASPSPSHSPSTSSQLRPVRLGNAAGPAALPSSLLITLMVGLATAAAAVLL